MELLISIQPIAGGGFLARSGEPIAETAEAPTREEAVERLRSRIAGKIRSGVEVRLLPVASPETTTLGPGMTMPDRELGEGLSGQTNGHAEPPCEFPRREDPLERFAGDLKDDPLHQEWLEAMREYRRKVEESPEPW